MGEGVGGERGWEGRGGGRSEGVGGGMRGNGMGGVKGEGVRGERGRDGQRGETVSCKEEREVRDILRNF